MPSRKVSGQCGTQSACFLSLSLPSNLGFPRFSLSDTVVEAKNVLAWGRRVDTVSDNPFWYKVRFTPILITGQTGNGCVHSTDWKPEAQSCRSLSSRLLASALSSRFQFQHSFCGSRLLKQVSGRYLTMLGPASQIRACLLGAKELVLAGTICGFPSAFVPVINMR